MVSFKYNNPKRKWEIIFRYLMYPTICVLLVETFVFITLSDHISIRQFVLYILPTPMLLTAIIVPVLSLTFWYGGSRIISIEYESGGKVLRLQHYDWLFRKKEKEFFLDNLSFHSFHICAPFLFYKVSVIRLNDTHAKRTLYFTSGLGWKRKIVEEIHEKLNKIK